MRFPLPAGAPSAHHGPSRLAGRSGDHLPSSQPRPCTNSHDYPHTISIIDCVKSLDVWLGLAFERLCVKNARYLAEIMGFAPKVIRACPHFGKADRSFQIDLLYLRADNVITVCEVKCYNAPVSTSIAPELQAKIDSLKVPRGYSVEKALISLYGPDKALKNAGIFDYSVTLEDILGVRKG